MTISSNAPSSGGHGGLVNLADIPSWTRLSPLSDDERPMLLVLVGRLRDGNASVIERVLRELFPLVERWVRRLCGPRSDVDDIAQEALTEIASALHRFEGRSSIQTLAHRITTRTAARFFRRPVRHEAQDLDVLPASDPGPESDAATRQHAARLYALLENLSEVRRTAFVLCCVEELPPAEAAEIVGCSAVTMRSRLFEARAELSALLAKESAREDARLRRTR